jgi:hypothetical protein
MENEKINDAPRKKIINATELGNIIWLHINLTCDEPVQTSPRLKPAWAALLFRIREDSVSKFAPNICLVRSCKCRECASDYTTTATLNFLSNSYFPYLNKKKKGL